MTNGRILYVHGAGNRAAEAAANADALRARLGIVATPGLLVASSWGETLGPDARLPELDRTLPQVVDRSFVSAAEASLEAGELADGLSPLRALATPTSEGTPVTEAALILPAAHEADQLLAFFALGGVDLAEHSLSADELALASREVAASPEYRAARGSAEAVIEATVLSVVATAIERRPAMEAGFGGLDLGQIRRAVVDVAGTILGGGTLAAVGVWAIPKISPALSLWASRKLAGHRRAAMRAKILPAVDVLYYQRNGAAIREHVRREIQALDTPRLVIGHSLGGIILVDTLFGPDASQVEVALLVTFGSQSAFLRSFGAHDAVDPNVPWLNIWATYDFVSFLDEQLWPGLVEDRELVVDVGFPEAHGVYYSEDALGSMIRSHPAAQDVFA